MDQAYVAEIVFELISRGHEGSYWDFKAVHHENAADLVFDIICMSNNLANRDAFIIFGVNDSGEIVGLEKDANKRNGEHIRALLKDKKFASAIRPEIDFFSIDIGPLANAVDVIVIKNTTNTPYYLTEKYSNGSRTIRANHIYTRINDTNTDIDKSADINHVEYLWKKRFGIESTIWERYLKLLVNPAGWVMDWGNKDYAFNKFYPEYQMKHDEFKSAWQPTAAFYTNPSMFEAKLFLYYHSTIMFETVIWAVDEYRKFIPMATNEYLESLNIWYQYFDLSTVNGQLFSLFTNDYLDYSSRESRQIQFCIFSNKGERLDFNEYVLRNRKSIDDKEIKQDYAHEIEIDKKLGGIAFSVFHVAVIGELYKQWRKEKPLER